jgi:hypothetical protein
MYMSEKKFLIKDLEHCFLYAVVEFVIFVINGLYAGFSSNRIRCGFKFFLFLRLMKEKEKKAHSREARGMEKHGFLLEWYAATAQVQTMLLT